MSGAVRTPLERAWLAAGVVLVLVVAVAGWFLVVSPELSRADAKHDATDVARQSNQALARHVAQLRENAAQLAQLRTELSAAYAALPGAPDVDTFTRQLASAARESGVRLTGITVTPPAPIGASSAPSSAPGAAVPSTAGQTSSISVTVVSSGSTADEQQFARLVQHGPRAVLVTKAALAPPASGGQSSDKSTATLTLTAQLFTQTLSAQDSARLRTLLDPSPTS